VKRVLRINVKNACFLDIAAAPNHNSVVIASNDYSRPDADIFTDRHIADDDDVFENEATRVDRRGSILILIERHYDLSRNF
jgi:hypothetical protein